VILKYWPNPYSIHFDNRAGQIKLVAVVSLLTYSGLARFGFRAGQNYLDCDFLDFPQSLQANARIVP
jgi:hypothetical protein